MQLKLPVLIYNTHERQNSIAQSVLVVACVWKSAHSLFLQREMMRPTGFSILADASSVAHVN